MARFDVYANPGKHATTTPYLLNVQSDLLDDLGSCVVIPLRRLSDFPNVKLSAHLTPVFEINGENYLLETPKLGAVPRRVLKHAVASLTHEHAKITAALDFCFTVIDTVRCARDSKKGDEFLRRPFTW